METTYEVSNWMSVLFTGRTAWTAWVPGQARPGLPAGLVGLVGHALMPNVV
jgi:hypothetical protein